MDLIDTQVRFRHSIMHNGRKKQERRDGTVDLSIPSTSESRDGGDGGMLTLAVASGAHTQPVAVGGRREKQMLSARGTKKKKKKALTTKKTKHNNKHINNKTQKQQT